MWCYQSTTHSPSQFNAVAGTDYSIWASHGSYNGDAVLYYTLTLTPRP